MKKIVVILAILAVSSTALAGKTKVTVTNNTGYTANIIFTGSDCGGHYTTDYGTIKEVCTTIENVSDKTDAVYTFKAGETNRHVHIGFPAGIATAAMYSGTVDSQGYKDWVSKYVDDGNIIGVFSNYNSNNYSVIDNNGGCVRSPDLTSNTLHYTFDKFEVKEVYSGGSGETYFSAKCID